MWAGRRHWREHSILNAQFVTFAAVTAVFFGETSYLAYIDVYWIIFAAGILATWLSEFKTRRQSKPTTVSIRRTLPPHGRPKYLSLGLEANACNSAGGLCA
jgi:hypothetical protein